ncbi:HpcH/HpaI aldolase/citrate lyase family protein [Nocardioides sp.]|uniref:HpcH/HpaI aldolase/citrate lyase family protein n=1 Tax=Nocardioides sp. TaxID=35761 RepID=UPI003D10A40B
MTKPWGASLSWLFVPGDRPDRYAKAVASGAHQVIIDLEDAVAVPEKEAARHEVVTWLLASGAAWVRVNAVGTAWHAADLDAVLDLPGLRGLVLPKATASSVAEAADRSRHGVPILALVETAVGIVDVSTTAAHPDVVALAFGAVDLAADLEVEETGDALLYGRSRVVLAARASGLPAPIDGVTLDVRDPATTAASARRAVGLGFGGKLCVHPLQVPVVHDAFAPTPEQLRWATRVAEAIGGLNTGGGEVPSGTWVVDGQFVDRPVLLRVQRLLTLAEASV